MSSISFSTLATLSRGLGYTAALAAGMKWYKLTTGCSRYRIITSTSQTNEQFSGSFW
jgi:hypothetical protein